jgi:hypothetical protein
MKTLCIVYAMVDDLHQTGRSRAEDMLRLVTLHLCVHWPLFELYLIYILDTDSALVLILLCVLITNYCSEVSKFDLAIDINFKNQV